MRFVLITLNISLCLILTVFGRPEVSKLNEITSKKYPNNIEEYLEDELDENTRAKKSTITTFCVEIRPADEKPYRVCEPVTEKGGYGNPTPYFQQNGGFEHSKSDVSFNSGSSVQSKPASAAYLAPVKTYQSSGSSTASKPSYGTYRSTKPEREEEPEKMNPAMASKAEIMDKVVNIQDRMSEVMPTLTQDSTVRKNQESNDKDQESDSMRTSHHQESYSYGSGYGSPSSMVPVTPTHHGHSGLVITCQPNLAGYAHNIPGSYHESSSHGDGVPTYNYRSASASYGRPYQPYRLQPQQYGNYKPYNPRPVYRPQAQIYKGPVYSNPYSHPSTSSKPSHAYKQPVGMESGDTSISTPHPMTNEYSAYQPQVPPAPLPLSPPSQAQQPAPPTNYQQPTNYPPASNYQPSASYYSPPPETSAPEFKPPSSYSSAYVPPPAYRTAGEEHLEIAGKMDKEAHTLMTMEKISEKNAENSHWASEIQTSKDTEARKADQNTWREPEGGNWRMASEQKGFEMNKDSGEHPQGLEEPADQSAMREAVGGDWRMAPTKKTFEMRDDAMDKDSGEHGLQNWDHLATANFKNTDNSQGLMDKTDKIMMREADTVGDSWRIPSPQKGLEMRDDSMDHLGVSFGNTQIIPEKDLGSSENIIENTL
ncbi:uncharacterized protein LOC130444509 [Diorhabda sublineata]|uniref:uncharacterized protein LOC130444509 n=1 Tax=Diorhabda sublineata TaxID=1163346 RepID=UPI0024E15132|nr:uncharacterized protein LOC130444509 [Diorhabda sublineata]